jgi:hypothetical protein
VRVLQRAAPRGYTLLVGTVGRASLYPLPYDPVKDFEKLSSGDVARVLVVHPLPAKTVQELSRWCAPKSILASQARGTPPHLSNRAVPTLPSASAQISG